MVDVSASTRGSYNSLSTNKNSVSSNVKGINNGVENNSSSLVMKSSNSFSNGKSNDVEEFDINGGVISKIDVGSTGKIPSSALNFSKITDNHLDAANGKFLDEKYILKEYWNGDFEYKIEEDGVVYLSKDGVPMGRTRLDFIKINTDAVGDSVTNSLNSVPNTNSNSGYHSINTHTNTSGYMSTNAVPNTNSNGSYHSINTHTNTSGYMSTNEVPNTNSNYSNIYAYRNLVNDNFNINYQTSNSVSGINF